MKHLNFKSLAAFVALICSTSMGAVTAPSLAEESSDQRSVGVIEYSGTYYDLYAPGKCRVVPRVDGSDYQGDVSVYSKIEYNGETYITDWDVNVFNYSKVKNLTCGLNPEDYSGQRYTLFLRNDADLERITFLYMQNLEPWQYNKADLVNLGQNTGCVDVDITESDQGYQLKVNKFNLFGPDGAQLQPRLIVNTTGEVIVPNGDNMFQLDSNLFYNDDYCMVVKTGDMYTVVYLFGVTDDGKYAQVRIDIPPITGVDNLVSVGDVPVTYYNLQGLKVNPENLHPGVYLRRQGDVCAKVLIK